jgi:hypothetical protein
MKVAMVTMTKEETMVAKESVDDASYVTDQVIRKFAIHAINVPVLYALTTAKCCARSVKNNINTSSK